MWFVGPEVSRSPSQLWASNRIPGRKKGVCCGGWGSQAAQFPACLFCFLGAWIGSGPGLEYHGTSRCVVVRFWGVTRVLSLRSTREDAQHAWPIKKGDPTTTVRPGTAVTGHGMRPSVSSPGVSRWECMLADRSYLCRTHWLRSHL
jgi:hypothetical protein